MSPACPSVCRLSVRNARAPYSSGVIFAKCSTAFGTLAIHWHARKILWRSSQRNAPVVGSCLCLHNVLSCRRSSATALCWPRHVRSPSSLCATITADLIGSRMWAFDWYQNRWPWMTLNSEIGSIRGALRKSGWRRSQTFCDRNVVQSI